MINACEDIKAKRRINKQNDAPEIDDRTFEIALQNCRLQTPDISVEAAESVLGDMVLALETDADTILTLYSRSKGKPPILCCSIQENSQSNGFWTQLKDSDIWIAAFKIQNLRQSMLSFLIIGEDMDMLKYRGPEAPAAPDFYGLEVETLKGELVSTELYSPELGETRKLRTYLPPDHKPDADWPLLLMADGDSIDYTARLIEPLIIEGKIPPIIVVGLLSGQDGIVEDRSDLDLSSDLRSADYLPNFDKKAPERFGQHMTFVTERVLDWAEDTHGAGRNDADRIVTGKSNGGTFSLHAAFLHPNLFQGAISMSPGIGALKDVESAPDNAATFWLSGGTLEPYFLRSAENSAATLKSAGYKVFLKTYYAGHAPDQWDQALAERLPDAFPVPEL
ncbi:MAG: alpha/beta hydrolase-fold protein [Pseudomonadota bacterium]